MPFSDYCSDRQKQEFSDSAGSGDPAGSVAGYSAGLQVHLFMQELLSKQDILIDRTSCLKQKCLLIQNVTEFSALESLILPNLAVETAQALF